MEPGRATDADNLGKMTSIGLVQPFSEAAKLIVRKLGDEAPCSSVPASNHLLINPLVLEAFQEVIPGVKGSLVYFKASRKSP